MLLIFVSAYIFAAERRISRVTRQRNHWYFQYTKLCEKYDEPIWAPPESDGLFGSCESCEAPSKEPNENAN
jgi:hypothetical protein